MRVAHVITRLVVGGAQENTIATVLGLHQTHHTDVELLSGPTTGPEGSLESCFKDFPALLKIVPDLTRAPDPWRDPRAYADLVSYFRRTRPEIVHTHSGKAGILGRAAAKRAGVPVIVHTIHGPSFGSFQGSIANTIFRAAERWAGRFTTHFVSVADAMTQQYLAAGISTPERYTTIFSGFNLQPFLAAENSLALRKRLGLAADDVVFGKVARLFALKGHDDLIRIAPRVVAEVPKAKFLFVGDGALRSQLESQIKELGLIDRFVFAGLVTPGEVAAHIGVMDILVHLSRREGLPRALPQALAAGKPVVAFDCDGAREVCRDGETGFLVQPDDFDRLHSSLVRLGQDAELRRRFGRNGRALIEKSFDVATMVQKIHALYGRLLGKEAS